MIVTLRAKGDVAELERRAAANPAAMQSIVDKAKTYGVIAHRFYGNDDGDLMVLDEWPDAESFQKFFHDTEDEIGPLMQAAGVTAEPEVKFWRQLDTNDEVGWGA